MLGQTVRDLELIALDDGSTDDTWPILRAAAARDSRLSLLRHATNSGHVAAMNALHRAARGTFVVMLGADDVAVSEDALAVQLEALHRSPEAGYAYGDYELMDQDGRPIGRERVDAPAFLSATETFARLLLGNFVPHSGTVVRAECYERLGWNDPAFHYSHDWELWLRLSSQYGAAHVERPLYRYRMHGMSLRRTADLERTVPEFHAVVDRAAAYSPLPPDRFARLRRRGHANANVLRAGVYLARGQHRAALADIAAAARTDWRALLTPFVPRTALSALLGAVLGRRKASVLITIRRYMTRR